MSDDINRLDRQAEEIFHQLSEEANDENVVKIQEDQAFTKKNEDFYIRLRKQIKLWLKSKNGKENRWAEFILFAPDLFHVLLKLVIDPDVPVSEKARLVGVVGYFVLPFDLMPEGLMGPIGYLDDIAFAAYILNRLLNCIDPEIVFRHWSGDKDLFVVIQQILKVVDQMMSKGVWNILKGYGNPKG